MVTVVQTCALPLLYFGQIAGRTTGSIAVYDGSSQKANFSIGNIKIEVGYKATAWSFAPNDPLKNGQNLLRNGARERLSTNNLLDIPLGSALVGYEGQTITISFEARATDTDQNYYVCAAGTGVSFSHDIGSALRIPISSYYERYYFDTVVYNYGGSETGGVIRFYAETTKEADFYIRNVKIELGDTLTEWTPYPGE